MLQSCEYSPTYFNSELVIYKKWWTQKKEIMKNKQSLTSFPLHHIEQLKLFNSK